MHARRALLYVPGDDLHKIEKAAGLRVDAIILDIEDGVAQNRKEVARATISRVLKEMDFGNKEKLVRVNPISSSNGEKDLREILPSCPDGIVLPKIHSTDELSRVERIIAEEEEKYGFQVGQIRLIVIIETAQAFINLQSICGFTDRLDALIFGGEDLAAELGATRTPEALELLYARSSLVMHAAAFGLQAVDMVTVEFRDLEVLKRESRFGAQLGYTGKQIIHPAQVEPVQNAFTPSSLELKKVQELVDAFEENQKRGKGAFAFEGKMVDMPVIRRAQNILARGNVTR